MALPNIPKLLGGAPTSTTKNIRKSRHQIHVHFLPWEDNAFTVRDGIVGLQWQKRIGAIGSFALNLLGNGYEQRLKPDDWCWIFVDPSDGGPPEGVMIGMIDRIERDRSIDESGQRRTSVKIVGSGWEKSLQKTQAFNDPILNAAALIENIWAILDQVSSRTNDIPAAPQDIAKLIPALVQAWLTTLAFRDSQSAIGVVPGASSAQVEAAVGNLARKAVTTIGDIIGESLLPLAGGRQVSPGMVGIIGDALLPLGGGLAASPVPLGVNVPQLNVPVFNILKMLIEPIEDSVTLTAASWIGQMGASALQMISALSNQPINEVIYDSRNVSNPLAGLRSSADIKRERKAEEGVFGLVEDLIDPFADVAAEASSIAERPVVDNLSAAFFGYAPHLILRRRPLFREEFVRLPTVSLHVDELVSYPLGKSDVELANVVFLNPHPYGGISDPVVKVFGSLSDYINPQSFIRHGLRYYAENVSALPREEDWLTKDYANLKPWASRINRSMQQNADLENGTIVVRKFVRDAVIGCALVLRDARKLPARGPAQEGAAYGYSPSLANPVPITPVASSKPPFAESSKVFYIEGVTGQWSYPGVLTYAFEVTRGQDL